ADLTTIAEWLTTLGRSDQPLLDEPLPTGSPEFVVAARRRLELLAAEDIASEAINSKSIAALFGSVLTAFDERAQEVLRRRLFADDPDTLTALGDDYSVTRERIRQVEAKARGRMYAAIAENGPLHDVAVVVRDLIGMVRPLEDLIRLVPGLAETVRI